MKMEQTAGNFYREWAPALNRRKGLFIPDSNFELIKNYRNPGYSSIYLLSKEDAQTFKASGSSSGVKDCPVAAYELWIDIDTGLTGLEPVASKIEEAGFEFDLYSSGGKGYHIRIPHALLYDIRLPHSHKMFLKRLLGAAFAQVDATLYQHGRLLSLPGRIHPKTGNQKTFLKHFPGSRPIIDIVDTEVKANFEKFNPNLELLSEGLLAAFDLSCIEPGKGGRHMALWKTAKTLADAGLEFYTVLDILNGVNSLWTDQKTSDELQQVVSSIFKNQNSA